jgi:glycosyltransferase involved in cell wall biosynthesis
VLRTQQKRLAIFMHGLYEGGAERAILNLAEGMAGRGYLVDLVLARATGPFLSQIPNGVRMIDLNASRVLYSWIPLIRYIQKQSPDALLSAIDYTNVIALMAQRIARKPYNVVVVEQNTLSQRITGLPITYRILLPSFIRFFYPRAGCIAAVSIGVADDLANTTGLKRESIRVIFNSIITPDLRRKSQENLEHPWFQSGQPPVIISVGRLTAQKDFPNLIRAFAMVREMHTARLMILGEGEDRPSLEKLIQDLELSELVSMPGFVDNPYSYMANAAVYVLSSRWEGLPTVLVEALYCGLPIVSTNCPNGPKEILQDGRFGQLVPVENTEMLASAIRAALDGKVPIAPSASWSPYTIENMLNQYIQALNLN